MEIFKLDLNNKLKLGWLCSAAAYLRTEEQIYTIKKHLHRLDSKMQHNESNEIDIIKRRFFKIIEHIHSTFVLYAHNANEEIPNLTSYDLSKITDAVTTQWISILLETSLQLRSSIHDFYENTIFPKDSLDEIDSNDTKYLQMLRVRKKYLQKLYPKNQDKYDYYPDGKFNILELYLFELMGKTDIIKPFFKLFFTNNVPLITKTNKGKNKNKIYGLQKAYEDYEASLSNLSNDYNDRDFVCYYLVLRKNEITYRTHLYGEIAKFMKEKKKPLKLSLPTSLQVLFSPIPLPFSYNGNVNIAYSPFLLDKKIISECFKNDSELLQNQIYIIRIACDMAIAIYNHIYKDRFLDSSFFENASKFLKDQYKIKNHFTPLNFSDEDKTAPSYFDYITEIYNSAEAFDKYAAWAYRKISSSSCEQS